MTCLRSHSEAVTGLGIAPLCPILSHVLHPLGFFGLLWPLMSLVVRSVKLREIIPHVSGNKLRCLDRNVLRWLGSVDRVGLGCCSWRSQGKN